MTTENQPIHKVVLLVNESKPDAVAAARGALSALQEAGVRLFAPEADTAGLSAYSGNAQAQLAEALAATPAEERPGLAVVFGGDGTMIASARTLAAFDVPLTGINLGGLGFLMPIEPADMPGALLKILSGDYYLERRTQIQGELWRGGRLIARDIAQNDIVINNGGISRMIGINLAVDGQPALAMRGDGMVVATPTGSTAYSLSAGGSIVLPETEVILITPVAAHSLSTRPLVVSSASRLNIKFSNIKSPVLLSFDGQTFCDVEPNDEIVIQQTGQRAGFIWPRSGMFFAKLKTTL